MRTLNVVITELCLKLKKYRHDGRNTIQCTVTYNQRNTYNATQRKYSTTCEN